MSDKLVTLKVFLPLVSSSWLTVVYQEIMYAGNYVCNQVQVYNFTTGNISLGNAAFLGQEIVAIFSASFKLCMHFIIRWPGIHRLVTHETGMFPMESELYETEADR